MERSLTKIRDVDLKILSELSDRDLLNFCKTHKYGNDLCNNEDFWRNRVEIKFLGASQYKSPNRTWKNFYLKIIYYLNKFKPTDIYYLNKFKTTDESLTSNYNNEWNVGLYSAALAGDIDLMKFFMTKGAYVLNSALYSATHGGHKDAIDYLISQGADNWAEGLQGAKESKNEKLMKFFGGKLN